MKKIFAAMLMAAMTLALSVPTFALGNFVLSTNEVEAQEEEAPEEEPYEEMDAPSTEKQKPNPNTGAGNIDGLVAAAVILTAAGAVVLKK